MKKILLALTLLIPVISQAQEFTFNSYVDQEVSCFGNNDGTIQSEASPVGKYMYSISRGTTFKDSNNSGTFYKLEPGTYKSCASNGKVRKCVSLKVTQPKKLEINFVVNRYPTPSYNNGSLRVDLKGGTTDIQPYLVTWKNSSCKIMNNEDQMYSVELDTLPADSYMITIEDDRGCFLTRSYDLLMKK
jgi:hypothetical protein